MDIINPTSNLNTFYIISQFFALIALILNLISIQCKKKTTLLNIDVMAAFCSFLHYAFLGAISGMVSKCVATVRNAIAASEASRKHRSSKTLPIIFVLIYIITGFFTFNSIFSILPILAPCIYTIAIYTSNIKKIRYATVATCVIWLIYDIHILSVAGIIAQTILIINGTIAIYRYRKKPNKNKTTTKSH